VYLALQRHGQHLRTLLRHGARQAAQLLLQRLALGVRGAGARRRQLARRRRRRPCLRCVLTLLRFVLTLLRCVLTLLRFVLTHSGVC
jgi:hypothetical protein